MEAIQGPRPGETWYARDGRVAQVFAFPEELETSNATLLFVEYSDGSSHAVDREGYFNAHVDYLPRIISPVDLVRRSPWDAVRSSVLTGKTVSEDCYQVYWGAAFRLYGEETFPRLEGTLLTSAEIAEVQTEALEFIAWAELRGLTPETLASSRGMVAA